MALYLSAHDCDPSSFWDDTLNAMDKDQMIFACMKTYAPLINRFCYVKGLSTPTWNGRKVRTVDYKKVNNIGKYTIEWNGGLSDGARTSYAIIKPGNLVPLDADEDDDDDDDDDDDNN